jgi:RND family efflux transporter MFP subunit
VTKTMRAIVLAFSLWEFAQCVAWAAATSTGITEPVSSVTLSMPVTGQVMELAVTEGSKVTRGDTLITLDRRIEALDRESKSIALEDRSAMMELEQRVRILEHQVAKAKAVLGAGGVSQKQVQDEEIAWMTAQAQLLALRETKRREAIDLRLAEQNYARRRLVAPITGVVTRVNVAIGETVPPQEALIVLVDTTQIRFRGSFAIDDPAHFHTGQAAMLRWTQNGQTLERKAKVTYVAPVADPSSGLIEVIATADNRDHKLIPGATAELTGLNQKTP